MRALQARTLTEGAAEGSLPWHVPATLLNATHAVCDAPPVHGMANGTYRSVPVELSLNGQLIDRTASDVRFEYYGPKVRLAPRLGGQGHGVKGGALGRQWLPLHRVEQARLVLA